MTRKERLLITQKDLAILKAAMQFWDEEISPHGIEAARPYFESSVPEELNVGDFKSLRTKLQYCKLYPIPNNSLDPQSGSTITLMVIDLPS